MENITKIYVSEAKDDSLNKEEVKKGNDVINMETNDKRERNFLEAREDNDKTKLRRVTSRRANTLFLLLRISLKLDVFWKQWLLCLLINCASGYREQKFAMEPQDQVSLILLIN